jgi:hypothetical protein
MNSLRQARRFERANAVRRSPLSRRHFADRGQATNTFRIRQCKEKEMNDKSGSTPDSPPNPFETVGEYAIRTAVVTVVEEGRASGRYMTQP